MKDLCSCQCCPNPTTGTGFFLNLLISWSWIQGCRSRPFWLEPEPFFGPAPTPTLNILFLRDPTYDYDDYDDYDYYDDFDYDDYDDYD